VSSRREQIGGVGALAFLLLVTAAWWALALWPVPGETPEWLARTRAVCFNATQSGLPDASGWLLLIGQPLGMLAVMMVIWGSPVRAGLRALAAARAGRVAIGVGLAGIVLGLGAAGARVLSASDRVASSPPGETLPPDTYPRLDRPAPALGLVDQQGQRLDLAHLEGRPALVTFAFGHCETVCPAIVRQTLEVRERVRERAASGELEPSRVPRVVVVTLDPWRDTPARLHHIAMHWGIPEDGFVLSGDVDTVNDVLDAWNVARERDPRSGDVTHPPLVYVVDPSGRLAYATSGGVAMMAELLDRS
jgi:protein SCO1/2